MFARGREGGRACARWGLGGGWTAKFLAEAGVIIAAAAAAAALMEEEVWGWARRPERVLVNWPLSVFSRASILSGSLELAG